MANLGLAITPRRRDNSGQWIDGETAYLDATVWGPMAEHVAATLTKGARVVVLGRMATRVYTPKVGPNAGSEVRQLEVVVDEIGPLLRWATAVVSVEVDKATRAQHVAGADVRRLESVQPDNVEDIRARLAPPF